MAQLREIDPPDVDVRRYSDRPLPPYRHVPGLTPHPVQHPDGHSYVPPGELEPTPAALYPDRWQACEAYLFGVDLYNRGYYWEAHETWEGLWLQADADSAAKHLLQAMIQTAAALLKRHLAEPSGVQKLCNRALSRLMAAQSCIGPYRTLMGIDVADFADRISRFQHQESDEFPVIRLHKTESG